MEKKAKFEAFLSGAGKTAKGLLDTAMQSVDQNDDGKFDFSDVSVIAESMGDALKKGTQAMKVTADEKARELELKALSPIFPDSLDRADFLIPKFIRLTERDKKRAESEVCQGSIGYTSDQKGLHIVNIFRDSLDAFGLTFYPDCDCEFYYVDPSNRDAYIALDEYFTYLKLARVNELQKIAQDLGAKYFKVTYKEEQTSFTEKKVKSHVKATAEADISHNTAEKKYSRTEVAAENHFPGHPPVKPQLKYLQRDPTIQSLIQMRMDETSPLLHQKYMLQLSHSCGMKEADAAKIDAVLKGLKFKGNTTVSSEAQNESRRFFEYDIEF